MKVILLLEDYSSEKNMNTPDHLSAPANPSETNAVEPVTLIDLMLIIVKNLRLLITGPVLMGFIVFIVIEIWPKAYESTVILKAEQGVASLINSATVLDPIATSLGYSKKFGADDARLKLKKQLQVQINTKEKLITLIVEAETPEAAQNLAKNLLNQIYKNSRPIGNEKIRLQKQLEQAKLREKEATDVGLLLRNKLNNKNGSGNFDVAQGYAQIIRAISESQAAQISLEQQIIGIDESALIQGATLPSKNKKNQQGLITILVMQATLFLIIGGILFRNFLSRSRKNKNVENKLRELKLMWYKALGINFKN